MSKTHIQYILNIMVLTAVLFVAGCNSSSASGDHRMKIVTEIFPSATGISELDISRSVPLPLRSNSSVINEVKGPDDLLGYWIESKVVSRSGPFKIRVLLDSQLYVKQARVISYPWKRGSDVCSPVFTSQFNGKGLRDPIQLGKDIDAISGATISSRVMTEGVRDAIRVIEHIKEKRKRSHQKEPLIDTNTH